MTNTTQDESAIRHLYARYADAVHRRDDKAWGALWAQDACWVFMGQDIIGRDTIVATWLGAMGGFPTVFHTNHSEIIVVDGDKATGRTYVNEEIIDAQGNALRFIGVYNDECSRANGQWFFQRRRWDVLYQGPGALGSGECLPYPDDINNAI